MPGLSQLKQFNSDILSLGNEPVLRSKRGEKAVSFPIPKTIKDVDDSEDFVMGMPEIDEEAIKKNEAAPVDEDFSDIMGGGTSSPSPAGESAAPESAPGISLDVPDLSSLMAGPDAGGDGSDSSDMGVPDLSMFMAPVAEEEPVVEEEPKEPEIADLSLDDLLGGTGFDGSEGTEDQQEEEEGEASEEALPEEIPSAEPVEAEAPVEEAEAVPEEDDALRMLEKAAAESGETGGPSESDFGSGDIDPSVLSAINSGADNADDAGSKSTDESSSFDFSDATDSFIDNSDREFEESLGTPDDSILNAEKSSDSPVLDAASEGADDFNLDDLNLDSLGSEDEGSAEIGDAGLSDADSDFVQKDSYSPEDFNLDELKMGDVGEGSSDDFNLEPSKDDGILDAESAGDILPESETTRDADILSGSDLSDEKGDASAGESEDAFDASSLEIPDIPDLPDENAEEKTETLTSDDDDFGFSGSAIDMGEGLPSEMSETSEVPKNPETSEAESSKNDGDEEASGDDAFDASSLDIPDLDDDFSFDGKAISMGSETENGDIDLNGEKTEEAPSGADESVKEEGESSDSGSASDELNDNPFGGDFGSADLPDLSDDGSASGFENNGDASGSDPFAGMDFDLSDMDSAPSNADSSGDALAAEPGNDGFGLDSGTGEESSGNEENGGFGSESADGGFGDLDFSIPDSEGDSGSADDSAFGLGDSESAMPADNSSSDNADDFPTNFDFNMDDLPEDGEAGNAGTDENATPEVFDTSEMEGMDFPETDAQLSGDKTDFELGDASDIKMDNGDFEIPGFSDVETVAEGKNGKIKLPEPDFSEALPGDKLPPNTLSDEQFQQFLKNLEGYPLNVRLAVEELVVKNEFTDDAEFEIIQKVLKKVSARQLASELEKMLDIAIPVPRDFEKRTAEEYEAYKNSFQYQLKNRILPGSLIGIVALAVLGVIFLFLRNFVYIPMTADKLYKQGYELLEDNEYALSREKFDEAVSYQPQKKWYKKYADGYRNHKQYIRAEEMYEKTLSAFNFDKDAGMSYADMELNDLANYEKTEKVLRRFVLDHHPDDQDAILALGDTYLEWGTEKDPEKLKDALNQYGYAIHRFGDSDRSRAGLMKYFVRTDNLREVLKLKPFFMQNSSSLSSAEWSEMGGYLLDKLYGPISPNDEFLRGRIEDMKTVLKNAVDADSSNPVAQYNLGRYYVNRSSPIEAKKSLDAAIKDFGNANVVKKRDMYKYIDAYRLSGELSSNAKEFLTARENYTDGITLFQNAKEESGLEVVPDVGKLYSDMGDIDYYISGDMDAAMNNYETSIDCGNDNGNIRYKIGYIQYGKQNYDNAIHSFMKASSDNPEDKSLLMAMGNTLSMKGDNYTAQSYYQRLLDKLSGKEKKGILQPQKRADDGEYVDTYMKVSNNLGVTDYRLARRTGNSRYNADAMINLQEAMRAWDAMTRNQDSMVRLGGGNLAEQNFKYVSHPAPDYEPAIYTDIPKSLSIEKGLSQ